MRKGPVRGPEAGGFEGAYPHGHASSHRVLVFVGAGPVSLDAAYHRPEQGVSGTTGIATVWLTVLCDSCDCRNGVEHGVLQRCRAPLVVGLAVPAAPSPVSGSDSLLSRRASLVSRSPTPAVYT